MSVDVESICQKLGYRFNNEDLLQIALTHRSVSGNNNERLEFLGDSILNFVIASELFSRYPESAEGDLSRMRASLVNKEALASVANAIALGDDLVLGSGEKKSGGYRRKSILADALEAIIGAIYLDAGFAIARDAILKQFDTLLSQSIDTDALVDPKTRLQEWLQARKLELPVYHLEKTSGKAHKQTFMVSCVIASLKEPVVGEGKSRRKAEQHAAERALAMLDKKNG